MPSPVVRVAELSFAAASSLLFLLVPAGFSFPLDAGQAAVTSLTVTGPRLDVPIYRSDARFFCPFQQILVTGAVFPIQVDTVNISANWTDDSLIWDAGKSENVEGRRVRVRVMEAAGKVVYSLPVEVKKPYFMHPESETGCLGAVYPVAVEVVKVFNVADLEKKEGEGKEVQMEVLAQHRDEVDG
ncbi:hypothetical protein JCM8547_008874 [Rhodosporidiobolus lusitaniae]